LQAGGASLQIHLDNPNQNSALYLACIHGDIEVIKLLLSGGCRPNDFNLNESSPLYVAAQEGHLDACKLLISNGADYTFTFREGYMR
jgi:ankyrin repeat protein